MAPALHLHDGEPGSGNVFRQELRLFPNRHPVAERQIRRAYEAHVPAVRHRAVDDSPQRHGTVQHDRLHPIFRGGLHHELEGRQIRVAPHSDVLEVHHNAIKPLEHSWRRLARISVQGIHRHLPPRMARIARLFPGGRKPEISVLRRKHRLEPARAIAVEHFAERGRLLREQPERLAVFEF